MSNGRASGRKNFKLLTIQDFFELESDCRENWEGRVNRKGQPELTQSTVVDAENGFQVIQFTQRTGFHCRARGERRERL